MNKLQEDDVWVGMMVSIFITITMFYFFYMLNEHFEGNAIIYGRTFEGVRERFIAILAVVFNTVPFVIYIRARKDHAMRGVGIVTVVLAIFVMVYFFILNHDSLLNSI